MHRCTETITVFNARLNTEKGYDEYFGTVIYGVSWFGRTKSVIKNGGLKAENVYTVRIPTDAEITGKKTFVEHTLYEEKNPEWFFTLHTGDIIVRGSVSVADARPAELLKQYDGFTVLGVTDNTRTVNAPHWKVVGA